MIHVTAKVSVLAENDRTLARPPSVEDFLVVESHQRLQGQPLPDRMVDLWIHGYKITVLADDLYSALNAATGRT